MVNIQVSQLRDLNVINVVKENAYDYIGLHLCNCDVITLYTFFVIVICRTVFLISIWYKHACCYLDRLVLG